MLELGVELGGAESKSVQPTQLELTNEDPGFTVSENGTKAT